MRDTFLTYVKDNLTDIPLVHRYRTTQNSAQDDFTPNAINLEFCNPLFGSTSRPWQWTVYIDILNDDELTSTDWAQKLWDLLSANPSIPKYDFTDPQNPALTGDHLYWDWQRLDFRNIATAGPEYRLHSAFLLKQLYLAPQS